MLSCTWPSIFDAYKTQKLQGKSSAIMLSYYILRKSVSLLFKCKFAFKLPDRIRKFRDEKNLLFSASILYPLALTMPQLCRLHVFTLSVPAYTYSVYTAANGTNLSQKKPSPFVQPVLTSVFVSFDKTLSSCLHWLQPDESQWYTLGALFMSAAPATHTGSFVARNVSFQGLWKHVNNPESVGASQYCCDHPTDQTTVEMGSNFSLPQGKVTGMVVKREAAEWMK